MSDVQQQSTGEISPVDDSTADPLEQEVQMEIVEIVAPAWNDITDDFFGAVKDLKLGELVHHEIFGLFEAMSAIEMMDPKMDAGMCCNKSTDTPLTFETAVSENKLKLAELTTAESIGIMDGQLSCLVSWLEGHSVAQTLFTCLYLLQPHQIKDKPLRAFCLGMRKLIQVMRQIICLSVIFEEEDFEQREYEFELQPKVTDARACLQLKEAEDLLLRRNKQQHTNATDAPPATSTVDNAAIGARLRFMRLLLEALVAIWPDDKLAPNKTEMMEIQKLLAGVLDTIPTMRTSIPLGTQPIDGADEPNPMGFSPLVNQRMLPPTFPRFTKIKARPAALDFLESMVQRLRTVCNVIKCQSYHGVLNFCIDFSKNAPPCLLSRAVLQTLYFPVPKYRFGVTHFDEVLRDAMRTFVSPPVLTARHPLATNEIALHCFSDFMDYCSYMFPFVSFIQLCGFNKARQRDKLVRLLADLASVGEEAERVDAFMQSLFVKENAAVATCSAATGATAAALSGGANDMQPYLGTWMLYHSLRAMHMYLLAGIELELFAQHEYIYIFWYLSQFLCNWMTTTLSRADQLAEHSRTVAARWPFGAKPTKRQQQPHGGASAIAEHRRRESNPYYRELVLNQAHGNLYGGFYKAMVAFGKDGRIKQPLSVFDNEKVRFEHRFAPFACNATLPPVPYEEFASQRAFLVGEHSVETLYAEAAKSFQRARMLLEPLAGTAGAGGVTVATDQEVTDIIRVTKVNLIVMNLMARGHMKDTRTAPTFDFSTHKFYPTIRIQ